MRTRLATLALTCVLPLACRTSAAAPAPGVDEAAEQRAIGALLDDWHRAASAADGARYLGRMAEDAVFLGTDASERWTLAEFRAFCEPYFSQGKGWTYEPRERHVVVHGDVAWFDEKLWNEKYGECRGTGALRKLDGEWRIEHYSLTLLVPNERAAEVVRVIRGS